MVSPLEQSSDAKKRPLPESGMVLAATLKRNGPLTYGAKVKLLFKYLRVNEIFLIRMSIANRGLSNPSAAMF
jgi:hypothetical protein